MSEIDISNDPEVLKWKEVYLAKGLPPQLLDEMIQEANDEYNSVIEYQDYNRQEDLTIVINDESGTEEAVYVYDILNMRNAYSEESAYTFTAVPCISLFIVVYKFDGESILAVGGTFMTHTKAEQVEITMYDNKAFEVLGDAVEADVANGKTFYNTDPEEIKTGTHVIRGYQAGYHNQRTKATTTAYTIRGTSYSANTTMYSYTSAAYNPSSYGNRKRVSHHLVIILIANQTSGWKLKKDGVDTGLSFASTSTDANGYAVMQVVYAEINPSDSAATYTVENTNATILIGIASDYCQTIADL